MPTAKIVTQYLCNICTTPHATEEEALACEALGQPTLVGAIEGDIIEFENESVGTGGEVVYERLAATILFKHIGLMDFQEGKSEHMWAYVVQHPTMQIELGVSTMLDQEGNLIKVSLKQWKFAPGFAEYHRAHYDQFAEWDFAAPESEGDTEVTAIPEAERLVPINGTLNWDVNKKG